MTTQAELYNVSDIVENTWNPNKMPADRYEALGKVMLEGGPSAIDPILIAPLERILGPGGALYIAVNGNHRLRKAKELGWSQIRAELDASIDSEEKARTIGYEKNAERGEMEPYALASYFNWFVEERKMTQEEVAKLHKIDRTTVTKTLSLLKIEPEIREKLAKVPHLTISHLEVVGTLKSEQQKRLVEDHIDKTQGHFYGEDWTKEAPTVDHVEDEARRVKAVLEREKEDARKAEQLAEAVKDAKQPTCPVCGKPAEAMSYEGLPDVHCENYHHWNLNSVKAPKGYESQVQRRKQEIPNFIRTEHTVEEFQLAFDKLARSLVPEFKTITEIDIRGETKNEKNANINLDSYSNTVSFSADLGDKDLDGHITAEAKSYTQKDLGKFKTSVTTGYIHSKRDLEKLAARVEGLFAKFGKAGKKRF